MEHEVIFTNPKTFTTKNGRNTVTFVKMWRRYSTDDWTLYDENHSTWYRKPEWDEEGTMAYFIPDSSKGWELQLTQDQIDSVINDTTNNEEEETTMKTTFTTISGNTFTTNESGTYFYMIDTNGKKIRIKKSEFEAAQRENEIEREMVSDAAQAELDKEPCRVEVNSDLYEVAVLNNAGCVDCSHCNVTGCVHRDCMRRNPRNVGGNDRCPRLDNGIKSEAQKVSEATGMELAEAELAVNVQNAKKAPRKARKSKDIAYEGHGKTLTAKQVDFILHLSDTCFWENGLESTLWIDCLCDEIGGQFANKPMTVGAMVSTLCEKGLGCRAVDSLTDMTTGRSHKATYFALTELGKEIAAELGLE